MFERAGFHGASLDQVARDAGFTKGAVYSAFESKADLFFALLAERAEQRLQEAEQIVSEGLEGEQLVEEASRRFAESVARERDWWAAVIEFASFATRDPQLRARYAEHHDATHEATARVVAATGNHGGDPRAIATAVVALNNGLTLEALLAPDEVPPSLYADAQAALRRGYLSNTGNRAR